MDPDLGRGAAPRPALREAVFDADRDPTHARRLRSAAPMGRGNGLVPQPARGRWRRRPLGGAEIEINRPEIIDTANALPAFDAFMRPIVKRIGIKKFILVRRATAAKDTLSPVERTA